MTLVALFAMTAGAWAQETTTVSADFEDGNMPAGWDASQAYNTWYVDTEDYWGHAPAYSGTYSLYVDGNGTYEDDYFISPALEFAGAGSLSFAYVTPSWSGDHNDLTVAYSTSPTGPWTNTSFVNQTSENWTTATVDLSALNGTYYIAFISYDSYGYCTAIDNINITIPAPAGPEVTFNADKTEASFDMPAYDVTVDYELVRDMSVQMTAQVGDGEDGYRLRIQKNAQNVFEPADMEFEDMLALFTVTDEIEQKSLTFFGQTVDCNLSVYAVDENDQPTGDAITDFTTLVPGRYVVMATAATGSEYDGQTAPSNIFELYQGYEVEVPAGEFITYYKDENLYVDDADAQLYTVSQVGDDKVLLSRIDVAKANMPILVKNKSAQTKIILLIPTTNQADVITPAAEFVGTLDATTIAASTENQNNYAMNGLDFVWVKDPIAVGPNKAWLSVATSNARTLKLVYDDATAISEKVIVNSEEFATATWYDLNGRKLDGAPTKKGVYILNGKKVVVK